jgi:hypothetical protein
VSRSGRGASTRAQPTSSQMSLGTNLSGGSAVGVLGSRDRLPYPILVIPPDFCS